ncbi:MAG: amino acid adenylation domain-containing protein [Cytophagales bacterium]|nr:amino acid adenylation domain-containing protein [Cytophagales bacterium]
MEDLLLDLKKHNISIKLVGDDLKLTVPNDFHNKEIFEKIRRNKKDIIANLKSNSNEPTSDCITPCGSKPYYVLSSAQKRMYFLQSLNKHSVSYNIPVILQVKGRLSLEKFKTTSLKLIDRHESLRTSFQVIDGEVHQEIAQKIPFTVDYLEAEPSAVDSIIDQFIRPFDLSKSGLIRITLVRLSQEDHLLLLDMHHIITDGLSKDILIKDFMALYLGEELEPLSIQYKDYAEWLSQNGQHNKMSQRKSFWLNEFADNLNILQLPIDHPRTQTRSYTGSFREFSFDEKTTSHLWSLCKRERTTMSMLMLTFLNVLLSKLSNQEDVIVGIPVSGREQPELGGILGMFVNTLAMRNYPKGTNSFVDFLNDVKRRSLNCYKNQSYPYEELIEQLDLVRDINRNPLFDVMLSYQNFEEAELVLPGLTLSRYSYGAEPAKFDLSLIVTESKESLSLNFQYSTELFKEATIERFINYFKRIVNAVIEDPDQKLYSIDVLSKAEKHHLLHTFNDTTVAYPKDKTIVDFFEAQVEKTPDRVALVFKNKAFTYRELNQRANQLANYLLEMCAIVPNDLIGVQLDRSDRMIISILGALKSGGAYLPIDPTYPKERIDFIKRDSKAKVIVDQEVLALFEAQCSNYQTHNLKTSTSSSDLLYVIYTSGSTGNPKGCMLTHQSIINRIDWMWHKYGFESSDVILQKTTNTFDVSVWEIFMPLCWGTKMVLCEKEDTHTPTLITNLIRKHGVSCLHFVPSMLSAYIREEFGKEDLQEQLKSLRRVITSGEALPIETVQTWYKTLNIPIQNLYGPTEASIDVTSFEVSKSNEIIPIGKPINNTTTYILDQYHRLQPIGVPGEICLGGDGLAKGYLNRPDLTAEKFIAHPFQSGKRIYKTGDLGRWLPDGNIEFLGRIDDQVKIRGFRIELGEIENQLLTHDQIAESVVVVKQQDEDKYLVAYYVSPEEIDSSSLRGHQSEQLPDYMLPSFYVHLSEFPLTPNGKIDKKALPDPEVSASEDYLAPSTHTESQLVDIWSDVLKIEPNALSVTRSFFELGGHSLKAINLINQISQSLNSQLKLRDLFDHQSIQKLGSFIDQLDSSQHISIAPAIKKSHYPLSPAQRRMYFLYELDKHTQAYNMPQIVRLVGALDKERLEGAFNQLISRHESLRTSFEVIDGEVYQKITEASELKVEYLEAKESEIEAIAEQFIQPFDLSKPGQIRVTLARISSEEHVLMVDTHHIITDGVSNEILLKDFMNFYKKEACLSLPLQYKDYAKWLQGKEQQEIMSIHQTFWNDQYKNELNALELPTDYPRPQIKNHTGDFIGFTFSNATTNALKSLCQKEEKTMFMVLLSVFNVLLSKLSNQEDIVVGTPTAGRSHVATECIIGMFVNTLPLRNYPKGEMSFVQFLDDVKQRVLACFEHESYPYEQLVEDLAIPRETSRNPLFDVMFSFQNFEEVNLALPGLKLSQFSLPSYMSKFDLSWTAREVDDELEIGVTYSTELFKKATIERFIDYFKCIVDAVIEDPDQQLFEIDILSKSEKHHLLHTFNNTTVDYPKDRTIVDLFEAQSEKTPDQVAVVYQQQRLTYRELNHNANQLVSVLLQHTFQQKDRVAILADKSIEVITAMLAVLKAGMAYVPIDPQYPEKRIKHVLNDARVNIILTNIPVSLSISENRKIINLKDVAKSESPKLEKFDLPSSNIAYIMYTSGTSGNPKGVMITHKNVVRLVQNQSYTILNSTRRIILAGALSFDSSTFEIWGSLLNGGTLYIADKFTLLDPELFKKAMVNWEINSLFLTASLFNQYVNRQSDIFEKVNHVLIGGDVISMNHVERLRHKFPEIQISNVYGPTENTTFSTHYNVTDHDKLNLPIGKPINNTTTYILDQYHRLQPIGVPGEICLGGDGLAKGYLNRPDLTAEKFIAHPFQSGKRIYKTGDLGRWLPDGNIEFLGRIDDQVKIRGFRIELGEIENQLLTHDQIAESVVVVKHQEEDKHLIAYYLSPEEIDSSSLRNHQSEQLPDYMLPSFYVHLSEFPLTPNGKIDKKALPDPEVSASEEYLAPSTHTESQLVGIWSDVLKIEPNAISVSRSFFELGGHSLKAINLINQISQSLNSQLKLKDLFDHQSIQKLGSFIDQLDSSQHNSIAPATKKPHYPLSPAQRRMYFLYEFDKQSLAYNMPQMVRLVGVLDKERLEGAFNQLISRHESLRTSFEVIDGEVYQKITEALELKLEYLEAKESEIEAIAEQFIQPFDLSNPGQIRVTLARISSEEHALMVDTHHIITDGVSNEILLKDFMNFYKKEACLSLPLQYKDYAEWLQGMEQQEIMSIHQTFWNDQYINELNALELPTDYPRPQIKNHTGDFIGFTFSNATTNALKSLCQKEEKTMFMVLLSVFNVLLSKLSNQEDIVVGTPTAGRSHVATEGIIGMFVNTLPLRNYPKGEMSFVQFLDDVKQRVLACFEHESYPYEQLVEDLAIPRETSRNPLFDVMFSFQNFEEVKFALPGLKLNQFSHQSYTSKFDLSWTAREVDDELEIGVAYATDLFKEATIERFIDYFKRIVDAVIEDPDQQLFEIDILSKAEKHHLLHTFNNTTVDYPKDKTIVDLFEAQVEKTPDHIAVVYQQQRLTYRELNQKANQFASYLIKQGVSATNIVAVKIDRSAELIVGILAIMKASGTYLPIDASNPEKRTRQILQDSGAKLLVTTTNHEFTYDKDFSAIGIEQEEVQFESNDNVHLNIDPSNSAYIIYTSGSTGKPKGVIISHRSVVNLIYSQQHEFNLEADERILQFSNIAFDASVEQIWLALLNGSSLIMIDQQTINDEQAINTFIAQHHITHLHTTPSYLESIRLERHESLKRIIAGGDICNLRLAAKFKNHCAFYNEYGPTEATVTTTEYKYEKTWSKRTLSIGKPIHNTTIYLLDPYHRLQPIGVPGEICIGGDGLAKGYLNRPELTAEKFISHPYQSGKRIYKTGDLGRWLPDGNIEFLGRIDDQVKIRGFRIELGEIENQLLTHDQISESVVVIKNQDEDKYLIAYYVSPEEIDSSSLRRYQSEQLPDYMLPSFYVHLSELPLTPNGKIDKKAFPDPEVNASEDYVAPSTHTENRLVDIWSDVLKVEPTAISVTRSFFELGGHSLKVINLIYRIRESFKTDISLVDFFTTPTILGLQKIIDGNDHKSPDLTDEDIILLKEESQKSDHLFFIHDGSGDVQSYIELVKNITSLNCWGLRSPLLRQSHPEGIKIEDIAASYIGRIKAIQPEGPYRLAGWSIGGEIAYEMAVQLEKSGEIIELLSVIDSVFNNQQNVVYQDFSLSHEKKMFKQLLPATSDELADSKSVEQLWENCIDAAEKKQNYLQEFKDMIPDNILSTIPNFEKLTARQMISSLNTIRSFLAASVNHQASDSLLGQVAYFNAKSTAIDEKIIFNLSADKLHYFELQGDHFTILQDQSAKQISQVMNNLIKK